MTEYVIRYVITHIGRDGFRVMADPRQGRHTYATAEEAQDDLDQRMAANDPHLLAQVYGLPLKVRPCKCYLNHFDPMEAVFDG